MFLKEHRLFFVFCLLETCKEGSKRENGKGAAENTTFEFQIDMEKNTVKTELLLKDVGVNIMSVASFRNFVYVSGRGDKLLVYTIRKGIFWTDPLMILENGETKVSEPRIHENYFGCRSAAEEMLVDTVNQILLCRTSEGVYVGFIVCFMSPVHRCE